MRLNYFLKIKADKTPFDFKKNSSPKNDDNKFDKFRFKSANLLTEGEDNNEYISNSFITEDPKS